MKKPDLISLGNGQYAERPKEIDATKAEKVVIPNEICIEGTHIILRHEGHWEVSVTHPNNVYCSECLKEIAQAHREKYEDGILPNFCPNCGADMREKDESKI